MTDATHAPAASAPIVHEKALSPQLEGADRARRVRRSIALLLAFVVPARRRDHLPALDRRGRHPAPGGRRCPRSSPSPSRRSCSCSLTLAAFAFVRSGNGHAPLWLSIVFAVLFLFAFLTWAAADETLPVPGLLVGTLALSVPLIFGALGGVISERVGVVNVAIEGQLLFGAFSAALVGSVTGSPVLGLLAAMVGGMLVSFVLAAFSIKYLVDQVIVGVVLNVLVVGLTSFLYSKVLVAGPDRSTRRRRSRSCRSRCCPTSRSSGRCCSGRRRSST